MARRASFKSMIITIQVAAMEASGELGRLASVGGHNR